MDGEFAICKLTEPKNDIFDQDSCKGGFLAASFSC